MPRVVMSMYYHSEPNIFTDDNGFVIYDIFSVITPQDLFLFHNDPGHCVFPIVGRGQEYLCEIVTIPDETCDPYDYLDFGDDFETIARYEETYRRNGRF